MDAGWLFGRSGVEIYDNFQTGQGAVPLGGAADLVRELAREFHDSVSSITQLTAAMESAWQGDAAGAAERGAGPMVIATAMAVPEIDTAQDLSHRQVGSFDSAKWAVVPVPPAPTGPQPWPGFDRKRPDYVTYEQQVAAHNEASLHNVDVMTAYESDSSYNTEHMPESYGSFIELDQANVSIADSKPTPPVSPQPGPAPSPSPGGPEWRGGSDAPAPAGPGGPGPIVQVETGGGAPPQQTRPDTFVQPITVPGGQSVGPPRLGGGVLDVNIGLGTGSGFTGSGVVPVPANGSDGGGRGPGGGGRAGPGGGAGPEGGRGAGPRGGAAAPLSGGAPAGEGGGVGRSGAVGSGARGAGGGAPMGGMAGSPPGGEDAEHARPEWLEGGDPEELFGTDELTAPPVIGAEE